MRKSLLLLLAGLTVSDGAAAGFADDFSTEPGSSGWRRFGDASLFQWDAGAQALRVAWDSSRSNSYFYRPLGNILARSDDFGLRFDLWLESIQAGANPEKPSTFQIAIGFIRIANATNAAFNRGTGRHSPNLVEFNYFPAADFIAATVSPAMVSSNSQFAASFNFPLEMTAAAWFHVEMAYSASNQTLRTTMTRDGAPFGPVQDTILGTGFTDFRVDAVAVSSYNDHGDAFGSVLARGMVDNVAVILPKPPVTELAVAFRDGLPQVGFAGKTNWIYLLERATHLPEWTPVPPARSGVEGRMEFPDAGTAGAVFYRIRAERP